MNFIVISPHFPKNFELFTHRLHDAGINTLGIADEPYDQLSPALKEKLTEYYRVDNMLDYDQVYRAVAYFAHKYGKIDRIESHNEFWLELDARLRTDFNVPGYQLSEIENVKFKSKMKEIFKMNGIPVAKGRVFKDQADAIKLANQLGYPVVIKPDSGVGASNTYKISSKKELLDFFETEDKQVSYIMEQFISGDIVTFDGLTDQEGNVVFASSTLYSMGALEIVSNDAEMYYYIPKEIDKDVIELGKKCVKAFNVRERFFHFEFFRVHKDGKLMALEVNCRPPGGSGVDMFNFSSDIDVFQEYANIVKENQFKSDISVSYYCMYISRKPQFSYRYSVEEVQSTYPTHCMAVKYIDDVFSAIMGNVGFIIRTEDEEKLKEIIQFIHEKA